MWYFEPVWKFREKGAEDGPKVPDYRVSTKKFSNGVRSTLHKTSDWRHTLSTYSSGDGLCHGVIFHDGFAGEHGEHSLMIHPPHPLYDDELPNTDTYSHSGRGGDYQRHEVPPASPELRSMIAAHHDNHAWLPLLSKIQDEYEGTPIAEAAQRHAMHRMGVPLREKGMGDVPQSPHYWAALARAGVSHTPERAEEWHAGGHEARAVKAAGKSPAAYRKVIADAPRIFPGGKPSKLPVKVSSAKRQTPIELTPDHMAEEAQPSGGRKVPYGLVELPPSPPAPSMPPDRTGWAVEHDDSPSVRVTVHRSPDDRHQLHVTTTQTAFGPKHTAMFVHTVPGEPSAGRRVAVTVHFRGGIRVHTDPNALGQIVTGTNPTQADAPTDAPPPGYRQPKGGKAAPAPRVASAKLTGLLESHHDTPDWHPLVRQLAKEVPEHLAAAAREHMTARGVRLKGMDEWWNDL